MLKRCLQDLRCWAFWRVVVMIPALAECLCHSSTQSSTKAVSGLRLDVSNLTPCLLKSQYSPEKSFTCYLPEVAVPAVGSAYTEVHGHPILSQCCAQLQRLKGAVTQGQWAFCSPEVVLTNSCKWKAFPAFFVHVAECLLLVSAAFSGLWHVTVQDFETGSYY